MPTGASGRSKSVRSPAKYSPSCSRAAAKGSLAVFESGGDVAGPPPGLHVQPEKPLAVADQQQVAHRAFDRGVHQHVAHFYLLRSFIDGTTEAP